MFYGKCGSPVKKRKSAEESRPAAVSVAEESEKDDERPTETTEPKGQEAAEVAAKPDGKKNSSRIAIISLLVVAAALVGI